MNFSKKVWNKCKKIPRGKISTYKENGKSLNSKAYRAIGQALKNNPYAPIVPCHRVVKSDGSIGGYQGTNSLKKEKFLKIEGIVINKGKIKEFKQKLYRF